MKRTIWVGLVAGLALCAQDAAMKPKKGHNLQGSVQSVEKGTMMITVVNGNVKQQIMYDAKTKFMMGHSKDSKPGSVDEVKENNFLSCSGSYMEGKNVLHAKQCIYRDAK